MCRSILANASKNLPILFLLWSTPTLGSAHPPQSRGAKTHRSDAADCSLARRALSGTARFVRALKGVVTKTAPRSPLYIKTAQLTLSVRRSFIPRSPPPRSARPVPCHLSRSRTSRYFITPVPPPKIDRRLKSARAATVPCCSYLAIGGRGKRGTKLEINFPFCSSRGGYLNLGSGL